MTHMEEKRLSKKQKKKSLQILDYLIKKETNL